MADFVKDVAHDYVTDGVTDFLGYVINGVATACSGALVAVKSWVASAATGS